MNEPLVMFFGAMMSLSFAICFAPQVYKIYKNKSSKNVSCAMCVLQIAGNVGGLGLAFSQESDFWFKLNYGFGLTMSIALTYFWWTYRINTRYAKYRNKSIL